MIYKEEARRGIWYKQSGIPQFKIASLTDINMFKKRKRVAKQLVDSNIDSFYIRIIH